MTDWLNELDRLEKDLGRIEQDFKQKIVDLEIDAAKRAKALEAENKKLRESIERLGRVVNLEVMEERQELTKEQITFITQFVKSEHERWGK